MSPKEYIENRLNGIKNIEKSMESFESQKDLIDFIYKAINSKKFRKFSISDKGKEAIKKAIEINVRNNEPIKIAIPFGSYKLWRFEESPEVDWAELFAMIYYAYWLKPITSIYKPGVYFDFCGDDAILEIINNIPAEDTEKYKKSFRDLIKFIGPYLPDNLKYNFSPVGERYSSKEEFLKDLDDKVNKLKEAGPSPLTEREKERIGFNFKPSVDKDLDFEENHIFHDAYMSVSKRRPHHKGDDKICICSTPFGSRTSIPLGTTKTSVVKFQTGIGILKKKGDSFIEHIISPKQEKEKNIIKEKISISGLEGKNFSELKIER